MELRLGPRSSSPLPQSLGEVEARMLSGARLGTVLKRVRKGVRILI
jgi:hypothetical protein